MKGDNHLLALTTTTDGITGEVKPLFAFPVQVCKATDGGRDVRFDIAAPSGAEREQLYRDKATGEVVEDAECKRGLRVGDTFREIPAEAIDEIKKATETKTMVAQGRMDKADFFDRYGHLVSGVYFLQSPEKGGSHKAYRLTYEALREVKGKGKQPASVVLTKRTARSRLKNCAIYADETLGCLVMVEFAFVPSAKTPDEAVLAPQQADVEAKQVEMARAVVGSLPEGGEWAEGSDDDAIALKKELMERAAEGEEIAVPTAVAETVELDNVSAMLEASVAAAA